MTSLDILNHLWQSTAAGLALLALVMLCAPLSARTRRTLGFMGLSKFALPLGLLLPLLPRFGSAPERWLAAPALTLPASFPVGGALTSTAPVAATTTAVAPAPRMPIGSLLIAVWFVGFATLFAAWLGRGLRLRRQILAAALPAPAGMEERLAAAAERVGLKRLPRCVTLDDPGTAGVLGIFSPILILPRGLETTLTVSEFEAVLLHELVHVQRRDNLWAALQAGLVSVFWFHPLVWLLNRQVNIEAEKSCDERVLAITGNADAYASGIVKCVQHALGLVQPGLAGVATPPVVARLKNILAYGTRRDRPFAQSAVLLAGVWLLALSGRVGAFATKAMAADSPPAAVTESVSPGTKSPQPHSAEQAPIPQYRYNPAKGSFEVTGFEYKYSGQNSPENRTKLPIEFADEDIRNVLKIVADIYELNLILPGSVKGRTTLTLSRGGWKQIFQQVLEPAGYTFVEDANLVRVVRVDDREALLESLRVQAERRNKAAETRPAASPDRTTLSVDFPDEDVRNIVRNVGNLFRLKVVLPDTLQGKTSMKLRDVTWRQIFQEALEPLGHTFVEEGDVVTIVPILPLAPKPAPASAPIERSLGSTDTPARPQPVAADLTVPIRRLGAPIDPSKWDGAPVVEVRDLDRAPVPRFQARPKYPFDLRRNKIQGEALIDFIVDTSGDVQNAHAISATHLDFGTAAVQAVVKWKYRAGLKDEQNVPTHMQVPIRFTIED